MVVSVRADMIEAAKLFLYDLAMVEKSVNPGELLWRIERDASNNYEVFIAAPPVYVSSRAVREVYGRKLEAGGAMILLYPSAARIECNGVRAWIVVVRPLEYQVATESRRLHVRWVDDIDERSLCYALTYAYPE